MIHPHQLANIKPSGTLLVLAASLYQLPTILTAKRLGYRVITTDNTPSNPGHAFADKSYSVDTTDKDAILGLAHKERVDGIISPCTDVSVPTAAFVAEELGLPGVPFASALIICDKVAFSTFLEQHSFPRPFSYRITYDYEPPANLFTKPWIIKPDRSSGSKGVFVVRSLEDFRQRLPETLSFSPTQHGILQEFIQGFQGTCEGILSKGQLALTFVLDRQTVDLPYVVTSGHHLPTTLPMRLQAELYATLSKIWSILNITDGPFDCDFVATPDHVYILEMTARMGGNSIATLLNKAAGFDIVEYSVQQAIGQPVQLPKSISIRPTAVILLGVPNPGRLEYDCEQVEQLKQEPWVDSLSWDVEYGRPVLPFTNGRHRVGEVFISGKDRADLDSKVVEFKRRLRLRAV